MFRRATPSLLGLLRPLLFVVGVTGYAVSGCKERPPPSAHGEWADGRLAPALEARRAADGAPFVLDSRAGELTLLSFGHASCSEMCPLTLRRLHEVVGTLGGTPVRVLYASVDVDGTPEALATFARRHPHVEAVALDREHVRSVLRSYRALVSWPPSRTVRTTEELFLIDGEGRLAVRFSSQASADEVAAVARQLLAEARDSTTGALARAR